MFMNSQEGTPCFGSQLCLCRANVNREEEEKMEKQIPSDLLVLEHLHLVGCSFWTNTHIAGGKPRDSGMSCIMTTRRGC